MSRSAELDRLINLTIKLEKVRPQVDTSDVWAAIAAAKRRLSHNRLEV